MWIDAEAQLSDAQALSGAASTVSTNAYDMGGTNRQMGDGEPMGIGVNVTVAADVGDADETYQFNCVSDTVAALSSPTVLLEMIIPRALLVAGYRFIVPIPAGRILEQFVGMQAVLGGTTPSITFDAHIAPFSMLEPVYTFHPDNVVIS